MESSAVSISLPEMDRAALEEARLYGLFVSGMALPDSVVEELADRGVWMVSVPSDDTRAIKNKVVVDRAGMLSLPVQYAQSKGVQRPGVIYLDLEDRPDRKKKILTVFAEHGYELNPARVVGVSRTSAFGGQLTIARQGTVRFDDVALAAVNENEIVPAQASLPD
jgi:DNA-binding LacI/PurR family transcriptional regulator